MSTLAEYKNLLEESLHSRVFLNDPNRRDNNIYVDEAFGGTLHQLYILRHWDRLRATLSEEELWTRLKQYEYRPAKLVFDSVTGQLVGDSASQELYKRYYRNALWQQEQTPGLGLLLTLVALLVIFYYIESAWRGQRRRHGTDVVVVQPLHVPAAPAVRV